MSNQENSNTSMTTDSTQVTPEEITQYREQFSDYPESLDALDLIEENDGDLKQAANLLALESGVVISKKMPNILDELAQKSRNIVCDEVFINELMTGVLTAAVASLTASGQIPAALATPVVIYLAKKGVKKWCESSNGEPKAP
jgi:hypothetical protein